MITAISCDAHYNTFQELNPPYVCDFDLLKRKVAWVNEATQDFKYDGQYAQPTNANQSQLYKKQSFASCRDKSSLN